MDTLLLEEQLRQSEIKEYLRTFPLTPYLNECYRNGRAHVPPELRERASALFIETTELLNGLQEEQAIDERSRRALFLAKDFLGAEHFLFVHKIPRYAAYMNMPVLERFLTSSASPGPHAYREKAWNAIEVLLSDWVQTEKAALQAHSLPGFDRIHFVADKVVRRLEILARVAGAMPSGCHIKQVPAQEDIRAGCDECDWFFFANQRGGSYAVARLTALPMSLYHDEYMFLRSANIAECCFWAIAQAIEAAAAAFEKESPVETIQHLNCGAELADFMTRVFVTFDTLPYESFYDGFRPATGNASTIQSENYQRMDFLVRGFNEHKQNALKKHCEVAGFIAEDCDTRPTLRWLSKVAEQHSLASEILDAIHNLHRHVLLWRAKHLGIARRFLPRGVVGTGEEGFSFLLETFRDP